MREKIIIQISDLHLPPAGEPLYHGVSTVERLMHVLDHLERTYPVIDLLLMTGDLSHFGDASNYHWLQQQVSGRAKRCCWVAGNHDNETLMRGALWPERIELPGWQMVFLDTSPENDGKGSGALTAEGLKHLQSQLAVSEQPTLLVMHHNPLPIGSGWQDPIMLADADALWSCLDDYPQVKLIVHGHIHQQFSAEHKQVKVYSVPAIAPQFKAAQAEFTLEDDPAISGPAYRWLKLWPDGHFESDVVFV